MRRTFPETIEQRRRFARMTIPNDHCTLIIRFDAPIVEIACIIRLHFN